MQGIDTHFLGIFLSKLSHKMSSNMTSMVSGPDYIAQFLPEETNCRVTEMLYLIKESGDITGSYIGVLALLSACLDDEPKTFDFETVIKDYVSSNGYRNLQESFPDVVLVTNTENCPSNYNGREIALRIIVEQLIANAFETTSGQGGGFVTLEISVQEYRGGTCYLSRDISPASYIVMSFKDTGGGIGEEKLKSFSDPYFLSSSKVERGFGFGLVSLAVQQINGHVLYEQEVIGSKICILIPFDNAIHSK